MAKLEHRSQPTLIKYTQYLNHGNELLNVYITNSEEIDLHVAGPHFMNQYLSMNMNKTSNYLELQIDSNVGLNLFFNISLNKLLCKLSSCQWFEILVMSL